MSNDDIVVTAQKREESLQDVPITIQAFTGETLKAAGITQIQDVQLLTPGLNYANASAIGRVFIRGVGNKLSGNGLDSAVATYVDDRYVATATGALAIDLLDVSRVEVLKGPQGTLFGRNATGGALRIITNPVEDVFGGWVTGRYGNYDSWRIQGVVNLPLTENFGIRIAGMHDKRDGYWKNIFAGGRRDWNDSDLQYVRGKAKWEISDVVTSTLSLSYWTKDDQNGNGDVVLGPLALSTIANRPGAVFSTTKGTVASAITGTNNGHEFAGEWRVDIAADPFDIAFISTLSRFKINILSDADSTSLKAIDLVDQPQTLDDHSMEFQILSNKDSPLQWLFGLYYYHGKDKFSTTLDRGLPGGPVFTGAQTVTTDAWAGFASGTYNFTDRLGLTVGGRLSMETRKVVAIRASGPNALGSKSFNNFSPRVTLEYKSDVGLFFATYSKGFKSGGFSYPYDANSDIKQEILTSYEAGFKGDFGRAFRFNLSAFKYKYDNMQVTQASNVGGVPVTSNAASSSVKGVELDMTVRPAQWFTLRAGGSYTDGTYDKYDSAQRSAGTVGFPRSFFDASGEDLLRLSKWSYFGQASIEAPVGTGTVRADATWSWRSAFNFDFAVPETSDLRQPAYGLLSGRVSYSGADDRWEVAVFGNNLLDKDYLVNSVAGGGIMHGQFGNPRTYGVEATVRF